MKDRVGSLLSLGIGAIAGAVVPLADACAQTQPWLQQFGTFSFDGASALASGERGTGFVGGLTLGSLFGPSVNGPLFLAKFDGLGGLLWGTQFGASFLGQSINSLAPAAGGGVFAAGRSATGAAYSSVWIARHDDRGTCAWIAQFGSGTFDDVRTLAPDGAGGVFVGGYTYGVLVSPPPPGPAYAWLARYNGNGRRLWLRQYESAIYGSAFHGATPDGEGGVFIAGSSPMTGAEGDAWVARIDANGDVTWARRFGSTAGDWAEAICPDRSGGVFVAGTTLGSLAAPHAGGYDAWVARYDAAGNQLALMQFGSSAADRVVTMAPDGLGGAFLGGHTNGALGGPHAGLDDAWIAYTRSGASLAWIHQLGTLHFDAATSLAPAEPGSAFVAGTTYGFLLGSPSAGPHNGDAWLALYETCVPDCDGDGVLTLADFACFQAKFIASDPYADCNADGQLTIADFGCFQTKYVQGCP